MVRDELITTVVGETEDPSKLSPVRSGRGGLDRGTTQSVLIKRLVI